MSGTRRHRRVRAAFLLALIPGLLGVALIHWPPGASLEKKGGLDNLFALRGLRTPPPQVCVVAIDDDSYQVIGRDMALPWPRGLHANLIRTLKQEGAVAVAFDVLFLGPSQDPAQDEALADALHEAGNVIIGASAVTTEDPLYRQTQMQEPYEPLATTAKRVAFVNLPSEPDGVLRYAYPAREGQPGLALAAYELATGDTSQRSPDARLLDYYGPARTIKTVSIYQALDPKQYLPPGFFKGKIVFVGASKESEPGLVEKDAFLTPYHGANAQSTFGVEVHATLAANLLEHREVKLLDSRLEAVWLLLVPLIASLIFVALRPMAGGAVFLLLMPMPLIAGYAAFTSSNLWIPLVIPSAIQIPMSYGLSTLWYYLTTVRDREKIKRAFGLYLSPEMVRRLAEDPDSVNLGGQEIVGTAVFTDIKGFTTIAEHMSAENTAAMLNAYFSEATRHVFEAGGTLIKFIGDAVFAIWGAPIRRDDHATQACLAALALARAQDEEGAGGAGPAISLATRIGVHTGSMLVGNLGSAQRFDYTAIGDAVNLASRIEGLNKAFGTRALASGETMLATDGRFVTRSLGLVRVVGRHEPVTLHELIGTNDEPARADARLLAAFAKAKHELDAGHFAEAAAGFKGALSLSDGRDGPSSYFLQVAEKLAAAPPTDWDGVVVMESK